MPTITYVITLILCSCKMTYMLNESSYSYHNEKRDNEYVKSINGLLA